MNLENGAMDRSSHAPLSFSGSRILVEWPSYLHIPFPLLGHPRIVSQNSGPFDTYVRTHIGKFEIVDYVGCGKLIEK